MSTVPSLWLAGCGLLETGGSETRRWSSVIWSGVVFGERVAGAAFAFVFFFFLLLAGTGLGLGAVGWGLGACAVGGVRSVRSSSTTLGSDEGSHSSTAPASRLVA